MGNRGTHPASLPFLRSPHLEKVRSGDPAPHYSEQGERMKSVTCPGLGLHLWSSLVLASHPTSLSSCPAHRSWLYFHQHILPEETEAQNGEMTRISDRAGLSAGDLVTLPP